MAREIEMYLMAKFQSTLDSKDKSSSRIPMFSLFQEIKDLLEEIPSHKTLHSQPADPSIRKILYFLNDVLSECQSLSKSCGFYTLQQLLKINKIKTDLNKVKRELKTTITNPPRLLSNGNNTVSQSNGVLALSLPRNRYDPVDSCEIRGFDDEIISLQNLILHHGRKNGFNSIAIVGMAGIGKTTISQHLFNKEEVRNYFLPRIWLCMSKPCEKDKDPKTEIVRRMLISLGVKEEIINKVLENRGLAGLLCALHQQLVGKRYLIVLDDAWEAEPWYGQLNSELTIGDENWEGCFGYGLPKDFGGTVVVNSRSEEVAKMMVGFENLFYLHPLSDPETCWAILKDSVEKEGNGIRFNPPNVEELKKEIKEKCGGLPLAAKMIGQLMLKQLLEEAGLGGLSPSSAITNIKD